MISFSGPSESHNPAVWAIQNPWFREHSSLAGALGEQGNQEASPATQTSLDALDSDQEHKPVLVPSNIAGHLYQPAPGVAVRVGPETGPESDNSGHDHGCRYQQGDSDTSGTNDDDGNDTDFGAIANLHSDVPKFCRVGDCRYWHTEPKQVKRHRDSHFSDRYSYRCPNKTGTCRSLGWDFRRSDAVIVHCRGSPECSKALEDNGGKPPRQGTPATEEDLRPEDRRFHIPYERFDGRVGRGRGRGQF